MKTLASTTGMKNVAANASVRPHISENTGLKTDSARGMFACGNAACGIAACGAAVIHSPSEFAWLPQRARATGMETRSAHTRRTSRKTPVPKTQLRLRRPDRHGLY